MSQMQFVKEGIQQYMVVETQGQWRDDYESNLMQYHLVPGFMPFEVRELDGKLSLYYKLIYRTRLEDALSRLPLTLERAHSIVYSIVEMLKSCEEYLLNAESVIYDPDYVFMDVTTGRIVFAYCPNGENQRQGLKELLTKLIQYIDKKNERSMMFLLKFYNLVTDIDCTMEKLEEYCRSKEAACNEDAQYESELTKPHASKKDADPKDSLSHKKKSNSHRTVRHMARRLITVIMVVIAVFDVILLIGLLLNLLTYEKTGYLFVGMAVLIGLTIIYMGLDDEDSPENIMEEYYINSVGETLNDNTPENKRSNNSGEYDADIRGYDDSVQGFDNKEGATVLLVSEEADVSQTIVEESTPVILYLESLVKGQYDPIHVGSGDVVIGSMEDGCDYLLRERGISRLHAKLSKREDGMYLTDLNSTNGTYINGDRIDIGREHPIEEGDMVAFAGSRFFVAKEE